MPGPRTQRHSGHRSPDGGALPIRLLQIVTRLDVGGVPKHVLTLIEGLCAEGYDVSVVCREAIESHLKRLSDLGVTVLTVDIKRLPNPIGDVKAARELYRLMKAGGYDIVHTHMSKTALLGGLVARFAGVPVVVNTAHNFGVLAFRNPIIRGLFWIYDKVLFRLAMDAVVTVSERVRDSVVQCRLIPAVKVRVIRNALDPVPLREQVGAPGEIRQALGLEGKDLLVLTVARLVWFKGLNTLLDATRHVLGEISNMRLVVVGGGPLRSDLERQAQDLGIRKSVLFLGERNDVASLLAASDLFVLSSVSEGMPISILEAMALSKPVVATSVGGIPELVVEGKTGLLVPPGDSLRFGEAMIRLLGDSSFRKKAGQAGRERLESEFDVASMVASTDALYRELISTKGRACARVRSD